MFLRDEKRVAMTLPILPVFVRQSWQCRQYKSSLCKKIEKEPEARPPALSFMKKRFLLAAQNAVNGQRAVNEGGLGRIEFGLQIGRDLAVEIMEWSHVNATVCDCVGLGAAGEGSVLRVLNGVEHSHIDLLHHAGQHNFFVLRSRDVPVSVHADDPAFASLFSDRGR